MLDDYTRMVQIEIAPYIPGAEQGTTKYTPFPCVWLGREIFKVTNCQLKHIGNVTINNSLVIRILGGI